MAGDPNAKPFKKVKIEALVDHKSGMKKGKVYEVGEELSKTLIAQKRAKKAGAKAKED